MSETPEIPDRPKVRDDLVFVRRAAGGRAFYVLKDPVAGRYFELGDDEYRVIGLLDGSRTLKDVLAELGPDPELDIEEIESFIKTLGDNFFLESRRPAAGGRARLAKEFSVFHFRIRLVNPQRAVNALAGALGFLFSVPVLVAALGIIGYALFLTCGDWGIVMGSAAQLKKPFNIVLFYLAVSAVMTMHELGHAVMCRRLGGEVREMGFMLLYFIPCFYTDVSDIYMMRQRSHRIAVIVAGPLVELTLWGGFTIAWFFLPGGGAASTLCMIMMLTSGVRSILLNFNPMIKVDGYYLLEEILGVNNLMDRSRTAVRALGGRRGGDGDEAVSDSAAEGRIILAYGILSIVYVVLLLAAAAYFLAGFFTRYAGSWSWFICSIAFLVMLLLYARRYTR